MTKKYFRLTIISLAFISISSFQVFGQKDTSKLNKEVEVIKPYRPNISTANKINQLPNIEDTTRFVPEFNYSIDNRPVESTFKNPPLSIQDIKTPKEQDSGLGYLKAGAGIYNTTLGEFYLHNNDLKNGGFGVRLNHLASQGTTKLSKGDRVDSPFSHNTGEIFGNTDIGSTILSGKISYERDAFRYYGYPDTVLIHSPVLPPLLGNSQRFQKAEFEAGLKNSEKSTGKLKYKTGIWYHYFDTKTGQNESSFGLSGDFNYDFEKFKGFLETSYEHLSSKGLLDTSITVPLTSKREDWLILSPGAEFSGEKWSIKGGVSFYSASSNVVGEGDIKLYPKIDVNLIPIKDFLTIYAGINGYLQNDSYEAIAYENYWVNPVHNVLNADHQYVLTGGVKGKINKEFSYNFQLKYEYVKNMHFYYLNSITAATPYIYNNAFEVLYDNAGITNLSLELSYVKDLDYYFSLKGNYYNYSLTDLPFTPDLPDFDVTGTANLRLTKKLSGFSDLKLTGQRYGLLRNPSGDEKIALKPLYQLNAGVEYALKPKLKVFGRADNLLNEHYDQWLGYTTQGLRLLAGITFSF
jgi:hypothetical protein